MNAGPSGEHTQARNACNASTPIVPSSCKLCTPVSTQPSSSSLPSCGTQALSDHRNRTACDHNDAFLARKEMPIPDCQNLIPSVWTALEVYLSCLVLRHLVLGVLSAILALAVGASGFGNVDLFFVVSLTSDAFQLSQSPAPCAQSIKFYPAEPPTSYSRSFRHRICPMEYEVVAARSR